MSKTKRGLSAAQKKREGEFLRQAFLRQQKTENTGKPKGSRLTQESIIAEMGLSSQGLFGQWCRGTTPVPDKHVIWLSKRLNFDPYKMRPSLLEHYPVSQEADRREAGISLEDEAAEVFSKMDVETLMIWIEEYLPQLPPEIRSKIADAASFDLKVKFSP